MEAIVCGLSNSNLSAQEKVTQEWDGMAGEWDDVAAGYSAGLFKILWDKTGIDDPSRLVVLDFGCGTGLLTELIAKHVRQVIALDASSQMVEVLKEKISCRTGLENVTAFTGVVAHLEKQSPEFRQAIDSLTGQCGLIVASSVLNFVPEEDLEATLKVLGRLLKKKKKKMEEEEEEQAGGVLFHSDWPTGEAQPPDGMTTEKAEKMYAMAGLVPVSTEIARFSMGPGKENETNEFWGWPPPKNSNVREKK